MTSVGLDHTASSDDDRLDLAGQAPEAVATLARGVGRPHLVRWQERNLIIGVFLIGLIVLAAIFAPQIAGRGPQDTDYTARLHPPSQEHLFGTDNLGRDIFSRVLHGAQIDLQVGLISVLLPFIIGAVLGSISGYYGGRIDTIVMRLVDIIQAFPFLILIIAIVAVLGIGLPSVYVAVALVAWVTYARLFAARSWWRRARTTSKRHEPWVAVTSGSSGVISCPTSSPRPWCTRRLTSCSTSC